jgi:ABC-type branched-subunit amino acid transport system substrate-binding protein
MVRGVGAAVCLLVIGAFAADNAMAQDGVKVGLIMPLTGQLGAVGKQLVAGARLYGGYDGMHLIYSALKKTSGSTDGDTLVAAMKGMAWESPRGPISIDPETRDIVQNIYIRRVEKKNGELYNIEFATFEAVKDPGKIAKP